MPNDLLEIFRDKLVKLDSQRRNIGLEKDVFTIFFECYDKQPSCKALIGTPEYVKQMKSKYWKCYNHTLEEVTQSDQFAAIYQGNYQE